jgi:cellulose synthase/poly-beta-1,6-N-acetylglucosamine synthase-like glycosyltransferase
VILLLIVLVSWGLVFVAWVVYPAAMWASSRRFRPSLTSSATPVERIAVVIATRDDPAVAAARAHNLRAGDYPAELMRIVVAVDRNAQFPLETYRQALNGSADVVQGDVPGGKAAALNAGVRAGAGCDILVFTDVGQEFNPQAISTLVGALRDPTLGGVTGRYAQATGDGLMAAYADAEAMIRAGQDAARSVVSASGSIMALKAPYWRELPAGLICDDLYTGLSVVAQGSKVGFCPDAVALDRRSFTRDQQFTRRVRTLTGLIQYCLVRPDVLVPWKNPVWSHFVFHKVLRLLTPIPLAIGALSLAAFLLLRWPSETLVSGGVLLGILLVMRTAAPRVFRQLIWVMRLQLVPVLAISNGMRRRWTVWGPTPQAHSGVSPHAGVRG